MQDEKLSQTESRMLVRWIERNMKLRIRDSFYFWRMTPKEVTEYLQNDFNIKLEETKVLEAIKA